MTDLKLIIVLLVLIIQLIQIQAEHIPDNNDEQQLLGNRTSDGQGQGPGVGGGGNGRRRQQNKHRSDRNNSSVNGTSSKNGWSIRRRNPSNSNNNNNNNPLVNDDLENPLFPPRSDSFWKSDHQPNNSNNQSPTETHQTNKQHGKKTRQRIIDRNAREDKPYNPNPNPTEKPSEFRSTAGEIPPTTGKLNEEDLNDRPNIILIITDDQDIELGSMNYMPETLKEFRENGIEFRHGYVTTPMCCSSRSSMLTGLYVHNHQVYTNNDNCSSIQWRQKYEKKTFAYQLQESGYYTSYIGKYLNKYDGSHIPQGWNEWNTLLMNSRFYNYTINRNGRKIRYGNNYEFDYYPDLITNDTLEFLSRAGSEGENIVGPLNADQRSRGGDDSGAPNSNSNGDDSANISESEEGLNFQNYNSHNKESRRNGNNRGTSSSNSNSNSKTSNRKNSNNNKNNPKKKPPFLLVISYPSPHGPEDSAPQYSKLFFDSTPHHTPSYNYAPNLDKQWILRVTDRMTNQLKNFTNLLMTKRLQTLQSVDVAMKEIFDKLRSTKLIENTFVFYTSDHGYHVGQFGLIKGKSMPYEFDIRVPFFVRVPQNYRGHFKNQNKPNSQGQGGRRETSTRDANEPYEPPGRGLLINEPVLNVDLSPTFLDIGRVKVPSWIDGRSFLPLINHYCEKDSKRSFVNQSANSEFSSSWGHTFIIESSGRREPLVSSSGSGSGNGNGLLSPNSKTQSHGNFKKRKYNRHNNNNNNNNQNQDEDPLPIPSEDAAEDDNDDTLTSLCQMHPYPCVPRQKKYCKVQNGRVRFRKCRFGIDYELPMSAYGNSSGSGIKCTCGKKRNRNRRSTTTALSTSSSQSQSGFFNWDWDEERVKIDQEIDDLKTKIENLREKRRRLRVEWLMGMNNGEFTQSPDRYPNSTTTSVASSSVTSSLPVKIRGFGKDKIGRDFRFRGGVETDDMTRATTTDTGFSEIISSSTTTVASTGNKNRSTTGNPIIASIRGSRPPMRSDNTSKQSTKNTQKIFPKFEAEDEDDQISKEVEGSEDDEDEDKIIPPVFHHSDEDTGSHDHDPDNENDEDDLVTADEHDQDFIQNPNQRHSGKGHKNRFGYHGHHGGGRGKHNKQQQQQHQQHPHKGKFKNRGKITVSVLPSPPVLSPTDAEDEDSSSDCDCTYSPRLLRQMERDERKRRKLMSKIRKKQRFLNRIDDPGIRLKAESCGTEEKMNCFWHDNDHWRTPPLWTDGSFCFCMNANNNTYTCLRSINATHDYLYCHFMTGFKMFFNLREDPHELHNLIGSLPASAEDWMLNQLFHLKKCQGAKDCWPGVQGSSSDEVSGVNTEEMVSLEPTIWEQIFGRWKGKRKNRNGRKQKQY